jgi:hypothetical protein
VLPDTLHDTATAEALQAIIDLDLEALVSIEPSRGDGRDGRRCWRRGRTALAMILGDSGDLNGCASRVGGAGVGS